ncbi:hypothetical protein GCM10017783_04510 [Deinococcus piscis]|uniref:Uncharacterized protein n=1 Tax=Deinococcus piscis TaxID=394230 RepID=A0ABQ3JYK0_9DEIO|nr:hypothetical protein GCM10017783_04510 [Deinococcus piscis]
MLGVLAVQEAFGVLHQREHTADQRQAICQRGFAEGHALNVTQAALARACFGAGGVWGQVGQGKGRDVLPRPGDELSLLPSAFCIAKPPLPPEGSQSGGLSVER